MSNWKSSQGYDAEELALFARYIPVREKHKPRQCTAGERCWVIHGPPALKSWSRCAECSGVPPEKPGAT